MSVKTAIFSVLPGIVIPHWGITLQEKPSVVVQFLIGAMALGPLVLQ